MPLYEYQCAHCGRFETIQKFSDPIVTVCPTCGRPVEKLASAPAIQFKGTGWYITDYARKSSGSDSSSKGDGKGKGDRSDGSSKSGEGSAKSEAAATTTTTASKDGAASGGSSTKS